VLAGRQGVLLASLPLSAQTARAQTASDTSAVYSGIAFSVASLVVLILAGVLVRRFSNRRKNDLAEGAGLDLMTLRQKNLLTPDEMKMVSAAIARRMAEKDARQKQTNPGLSTATLLHDPEVLRLQQLAQARKEAEQQNPPVPPVAGASNVQSVTPPIQPGLTAAATPTVAPTPQPTSNSAGNPPPTITHENAGDPIGLGDPIDLSDYAQGRGREVGLPPEVQKLADAGLLTAEEIQNIRQRLKSQQQ
jgi:hypothetical protein